MANQYTQGVPPNQMNPTQYQQPVIEPSMNEIMAQHQKQWQEHLSSTGTASQTTFNSNATQNTMPILPNANVPLGNMNTNMNAPMLQNQYIPPPIQPANNIIMNVVPQPSQRSIYQQQAQNYQNRSEPNLQNQYIPPPIQPANNIIMNVVPQPSQRTLYQQQAQNYQ
eukprot:186897_1